MPQESGITRSFGYLRAPYLHNASVPTLAQLIHPEPRTTVFCRGDNAYDPESLGLVVPAMPAGALCPPELLFRFDAASPGNSNSGHDTPWPGTTRRANPVGCKICSNT